MVFIGNTKYMVFIGSTEHIAFIDSTAHRLFPGSIELHLLITQVNMLQQNKSGVSRSQCLYKIKGNSNYTLKGLKTL